MSNQLPSNVYAGGAVTFNSTPYTNYYLQQKARNEAKKEAIDNYYTEMSKSLTPTGMAENDVDDFIAAKNQWQQHNIQNKNILNDSKNPNYAKVLSESNYLYNNAASLIPKSQAKVKGLSEIYNITKSNKRGVTDTSLQYIDQFGKPLSQGGGGQLNPTKIVANPDLFDAQKQKSFLDVTFEGIKPEKIIGETVTDAKTKEKRTPYTEAYNPKSLEIASKRALSLYENTPEAQAYFENELDKHGQDFESNNAAFKAAYGRDIANGKDLAIGWVLNNGSVVNSGIDVHAYTPPSKGGNTIINLNTPQVAADRFIDDAKTAVTRHDKNAMSNIIQSFKTNAIGKNITDWAMVDDGVVINYTTDEKSETGKIKQKKQTPIIISFSDPDAVAKLIGARQLFTGSDAKIDLYNPDKIKVDKPVNNPKPDKSKKVNLGNN